MVNWILGDKFDTVYPHQGSIKVLWESKWKFCVCLLNNRKTHGKLTWIIDQATKSIYPFHDGSVEDFEPIFQKLIAVSIAKHIEYLNPRLTTTE